MMEGNSTRSCARPRSQTVGKLVLSHLGIFPTHCFVYVATILQSKRWEVEIWMVVKRDT